MAETIDIQIKTNADAVSSSFTDVKDNLQELKETTEEYIETVEDLTDAERKLHNEQVNVNHTASPLDKIFGNVNKEANKLNINLGKVTDDLAKLTGNTGLGKVAQILNGTSLGKVVGDLGHLKGGIAGVGAALKALVASTGPLALIIAAITIIYKIISKIVEKRKEEKRLREENHKKQLEEAAALQEELQNQLISLRESAGVIDSMTAAYERAEDAANKLSDSQDKLFTRTMIQNIKDWETAINNGTMTIEEAVKKYEELITPTNRKFELQTPGIGDFGQNQSHTPFYELPVDIAGTESAEALKVTGQLMQNLITATRKEKEEVKDLNTDFTNLAGGNSEDNAEAALKIIEKALESNRTELEKLTKEYNDNIATINESTLAYEEKAKGIEAVTAAYNKQKAAIEADITAKEQEQALIKLTNDLKNAELDIIGQYPTKLDLARQTYETWLQTSSDITYTIGNDLEALTGFENAALDEDTRINTEKIRLLEEYGNAYELSVEQIAELDALKRKNQMNDLKKQENCAKAERQIQQYTLEGYASAAGSLTQIFDSMASASEGHTALQKGFATASALMSTYQSAQLAYNSAFLPVPTQASPIIGALSMAAAIATGLANLHQIWAVKTDGSQTASGAGSAVAATPQATILNADSYANVLSDTTFADLQMNAVENQKVYVVSSEISESQNSNKTVVTTSTF